LHAYFSDHFVLPLPPAHRFPMRKYAMLRARVATELPAVRLSEAEPASDGVLALAHHPDYVRALASGTLGADAMRAIGFPWSIEMVERARRSTGATIAACRAAIDEGVAVNLAGGTHHASAGRGEGFCCFNDAAVAARLMQAERRAMRVAIVDLDVHQGNGTASILAGDPSVFTLSVHAHANFPFTKVPGHLDVALPDGTGDAGYLSALSNALDRLDAQFAADLVVYLAGADVYAGDRLGRLALTREGIARRDRMVLAWARSRDLPVAVAMAGGYCPRIEETVDIHFATVSAALATHPGARCGPTAAA